MDFLPSYKNKIEAILILKLAKSKKSIAFLKKTCPDYKRKLTQKSPKRLKKTHDLAVSKNWKIE